MRGEGGCAGDGIITIYERAMVQVWLRLEAISQQHGVADALQALVRVSSAPQLPSSVQTSANLFCGELTTLLSWPWSGSCGAFTSSAYYAGNAEEVFAPLVYMMGKLGVGHEAAANFEHFVYLGINSRGPRTLPSCWQCNLQMERSGSHPLSFGQVAVALDQVTKALDAGQAPHQAQDMALRVASDAPINPPVLGPGTPVNAQPSKIQATTPSTTVVTEE